jgi:osmotically-inducible protein OsmY
MKTDLQIQSDVMRELRWDTRLNAAEIGVSVGGGVVTLTGEVARYGERMAADEAAHRVSGVRDVANEVVVRISRTHIRSDADIAHSARKALEWDVMVPDDRIQTTVTDGWVTLIGEVPSWHEREDAERAIRHLAGVKGVYNQVTVAPVLIEAELVRHAILGALERRAERAANHIEVAVNDGVVVISGPVRSVRERIAIVGAARHTTGVYVLEDNLRVDPYS